MSGRSAFSLAMPLMRWMKRQSVPRFSRLLILARLSPFFTT